MQGGHMAQKKIVENKTCCDNCRPQYCGGSNGAVYGFGVIGAAFYYFPHAVGASGFMMAIFKTLVWPAMLVFQALTLLKL